tara:strand:+ start:598 stop:705 length:108 start_codon:yes stop_codon:yes gene_type:complete
MNKYWTTATTGYNENWTTNTSYGEIPVKYIIKKKK